MGQEYTGPARSYKVPVVRRPSYCIMLERTGNFTFIHCDVYTPWTKTVQKAFQADLMALKALHPQPIYAIHTPGDAKHLKFLKLSGFQRTGTYLCASSGKRLTLYTTGK